MQVDRHRESHIPGPLSRSAHALTSRTGLTVPLWNYRCDAQLVFGWPVSHQFLYRSYQNAVRNGETPLGFDSQDEWNPALPRHRRVRRSACHRVRLAVRRLARQAEGPDCDCPWSTIVAHPASVPSQAARRAGGRVPQSAGAGRAPRTVALRQWGRRSPSSTSDGDTSGTAEQVLAKATTTPSALENCVFIARRSRLGTARTAHERDRRPRP